MPEPASTEIDSTTLPRPRFQPTQAQEPHTEPPVRRLPRSHPALVAALTFLLATPIAYVLPRLGHHDGGIGTRTAALPLACAAVAGAVFFAIGLRWAGGWLAGTLAGLTGAWIVMILSAGMRGTPFPMFGFLGDAGRVAAMATRYSVTAASADPWVRGVPADYPPLFPWLIGRTSAVIGEPAWRLMGDFEILFSGACVVAGFVLWQRLVKPWLALVISVLGFAFLTFAVVAKSYEALTLILFVPWALLTFAQPPRGRLHWLASGLVGGLLILTYYGWLVFGGIGLLAIAVTTWRRETDRRAYLLHLLKVGAVALAVSSWFVLPMIGAQLRSGGGSVSDLYGSANLLDAMFPFLDPTWSGLLQLVGLIGLVWQRGRVWWAWPLLGIVIGAYAFRILGLVDFVLTQHSLIAHYTSRLYSHVLVVAGVLTVVHLIPLARRRFAAHPPRGALALGLAVIIGWTGYAFTVDWMPGLWGRYVDYSARAYREPLPDGHYLMGIDNPVPWFPVEPIQERVEAVWGQQSPPVVLSIDERVWAYLPWNGYIGTSMAIGSLTHPFERLDEVKRLAQISDPVTFAREAAHTKFGAIDVFILAKDPSGAWTWTFEYGYGQKPLVVSFAPGQFAPADWVVATDLPRNVVVAISRAAHPAAG